MTEKPRVRVTTDGRVRMDDGFVNMSANIGNARDKSSQGNYSYVPMDAFRALTMYRMSWLAKKIINVIADDSTRNWRGWQADSDQISKIERHEAKFRLAAKLRKALILAGIYGGAALYFSIKGHSPATELDPSTVKKDDLKNLIVLPSAQLFAGPMNEDQDSMWFGEPQYFSMNVQGGTDVRIHPSRLIILHGNEVPNTLNSWTWGDSILLAAMDPIMQNDSTAKLANAMMHEAVVDVLSIPRLMELLRQPNGDEKVARYLSETARIKGVNGMLVLDGGDTSLGENQSGGVKYDRKPLSFSGVSDVWAMFMLVISGAGDIPATRIFGMSPEGMNSTGESDMHNYRQNIAAKQKMKLTPEMAIFDEVLVRSALGDYPENLHYNWNPIYEPTDKDKSEIGKAKAETIKTLKETEIFSLEILQKTAVTSLSEYGVLPGLEAAVEQFGLELEDEEEGLDLEVDGAPPGGTTGAQAAGQAPAPGRATNRPSVAPPVARSTRPPRAAMADALPPMTLYIARPVLNAEQILAHYKRLAPQGSKFLDADDLHVTVAYSRAKVDWMKMPEAWDAEITIKANGQRLMDRFGDPLKPANVLLFRSSDLYWRHETLKEFGATWDHDEYQPHITLSYETDLFDIEPWQGEIKLGPEIWQKVDSGVIYVEDMAGGWK